MAACALPSLLLGCFVGGPPSTSAFTVNDANTASARAPVPWPFDKTTIPVPEDGGFGEEGLVGSTVFVPEKSQLDAAIKCAAAQQPITGEAKEVTDSWFGHKNLNRRLAALDRVAAALEVWGSQLTLADAFETGVPRHQTADIGGSFGPMTGDIARGCAKYLATVNRNERASIHHNRPVRSRREPHKVLLILAPWNVPVGTILPHLVACLICGCSVVVKPSPIAPTSTVFLAGLFRQVLGVDLPAAALQVINGGADVGEYLTSHPQVSAVCFTGHSRTGGAVATGIAPRMTPLLAECGGSNAALVLPGTILTEAVPQILNGICNLNGQWCMGITRIYVHTEFRDQILQELILQLNFKTHVVSSTPTADPRTCDAAMCAVDGEPDNTTRPEPGHFLIGPMSHEVNPAGVRKFMDQAGGNQMPCGDVASAISDRPNFIPPTLILDADEAFVSQNECFGPVVCLFTYSDLDDAITRINAAPGQLTSYVFGDAHDPESPINDPNTLFRINASMVMANAVDYGFAVPHGEDELEIDFVGTAGSGHTGNPKAFVDFCTTKRWAGLNTALPSAPEAMTPNPPTIGGSGSQYTGPRGAE